jgi:hypothetical protein
VPGARQAFHPRNMATTLSVAAAATAGHRRGRAIGACLVREDGQGGAQQRRDRVDLLPEHHGHAARQHVPDHSASHPAHHAEQSGRCGVDPEVRRLDRTYHREQAQAEGVEHPHPPLHPDDGHVQQEGQQPARHGRPEQQQAVQGGRGDRTDGQIPHEAASQAGRRGEDQHPEDVQTLADPHDAARDGEDESAQGVQDGLEERARDHHGGRTVADGRRGIGDPPGMAAWPGHPGKRG